MFKGLVELAGALALAAAMSTAGAYAQDNVTLPSTMIWSAYDVGTSGYAEASAIANALQSNFDTRIRILPSGTSIGHLLPMQTGRAEFGFLANETFFASEGLFDFADPAWGPQNLRVLLGRPASVGIVVAGDLGIENVQDLRGKRVGFVRGNPSINIKLDAQLAFGGLTRDDVEVVWFGGQVAIKDALIANQVDAMGMVPTSSFAREIEASARGMDWLSYPPENEEGWENMTDLISFVAPVKQTTGAGITEENPVWLLGYRYPMIATYESTDEETVYNLVKAIDLSFDDFREATAQAANWEVSRSIVPPADVPWHEGAIRYAKEMGYWTDKAQAWQDERLARLQAVKAAWDKARAQFADTGKSDDDWPAFWEAYRQDNLTE